MDCLMPIEVFLKQGCDLSITPIKGLHKPIPQFFLFEIVGDRCTRVPLVEVFNNGF